MDLGIVSGTLVNSWQEEGFHAQILKVVQQLGPDGKPTGKPFIALDRIGTATGQYVLIETAMEATLGMNQRCAADAAIIAIVDKF